MMEQQNTTVALEETEVQELASRMRGELLRPSDAGYQHFVGRTKSSRQGKA